MGYACWGPTHPSLASNRRFWSDPRTLALAMAKLRRPHHRPARPGCCAARSRLRHRARPTSALGIPSRNAAVLAPERSKKTSSDISAKHSMFVASLTFATDSHGGGVGGENWQHPRNNPPPVGQQSPARLEHAACNSQAAIAMCGCRAARRPGVAAPSTAKSYVVVL